MDADDVALRVHPPERARRSTVLFAHGCCCCCCCCVHSLGGLAGSVYGALRRGAPSAESAAGDEAAVKAAELRSAHRYAARVYWLSLSICSLVTVAVCTFSSPREPCLGPALITRFLPRGQRAARARDLSARKRVPPLRHA